MTVFAESFPGWNDGGKTSPVEMTGVHRSPVIPHASIDIDTAYFSTMGIRLLAGRGITSADVAGAPPVVVIDERLARLNWPNGDAIGQQMRFVDQEPNGPWYTIVGIAASVTEISPIAELVVKKRVRPSAVYRALAQVDPTWPEMGERFAPGFAFAVHVSSDVRRQLGIARTAVVSAVPDLAVERFGTLESYFNATGLATRAKAAAFAIACSFGVVLCMLGVAGLVADDITRRTREIGVRIALGAPRLSVIGLLLQNTLIVAVIGVAAGLAASVVAVRSLGHLVFGVGGGVDNPFIVLGGIAGTLGMVVVAAMVPASRAASVDPVVALRAD